MSDKLTHECGIALIRLLKPPEYFYEKYGTNLYGFQKLFLLMEKQHNRGQDGAGIGAMKLGVDVGKPFMFRERSMETNALATIFHEQLARYDQMKADGIIHPEFPKTVKNNFEYSAEMLLGHLRYGTSGGYGTSSCHPYFRRSNWPTKNLLLAGNFNMTNMESLNLNMIGQGQHPIFDTDTQSILESIGNRLDQEHDRIWVSFSGEKLQGRDLADAVGEAMDPVRILTEVSGEWDGGYVIAGLIGNGDCFLMRDPAGIRPCFYFVNDEVAAFASERVALMSIFEKDEDLIQEVQPGEVICIKANCDVLSGHQEDLPETKSCTFERIYFSRGNDPSIYKERKTLGAALKDQILDAIADDFDHSIFSYIPNTAETAYYGLLEELGHHRREYVRDQILQAQTEGNLTTEFMAELFDGPWVRAEKIANKDIKLRTFITQEQNRTQLVSHIYDITYGVVAPEDNLVCIDDSIVRGTTLRESILKILSRTNPRKIIIASTAPQIRYPDCYGIDMSVLGNFIAFQAAVAMLKDRGTENVLQEVYQNCCAQAGNPPEKIINHVSRIYSSFTAEDISTKIAELVRPSDVSWAGEIKILYQTIENLDSALPDHNGMWYFTGEYPTPGGYVVLNKAYINYYENRLGRSY
ncbi:MAG: amidophosphoribosyltransferase [Opitutae bacterium]|nr:amidophosphoribosyltransferase [Opitutae bacterium]